MKTPCTWFCSYILLITLLGLPAWLSAENEKLQYPSLSVHGEVYANACSENEKNVIKEALFYHPPQRAIEAWEIIEVILCASPTDTYRKYVMNLMSEKVKKIIESTGSKSKIRNFRVNDKVIGEVMARGHAWNAAVEVESSKVVLQYFANEACLRTAKMRYAGAKWEIYELGEACD